MVLMRMRIVVSGNKLPLVVILLHAAGILLRWYWILLGRFPFNSDEAVVGLMANHVLHGEIPTFFYGQSYMGSLDAIWVSLFFRLFGATVISLRAAQTVLWIALLFSVFFLAREVFNSARAGWIALAFLAFPPVNLLLYSTVTLGGYLEALIIGVWTVILAHQIRRGHHAPMLQFFLLGLWTGFGLWVFGFSLLFSLPACLFALWWGVVRTADCRQRLPRTAVFAAGLLIGAVPWWLFALQYGFHTLLLELGGSAIAVEQGGWLSGTLTHLFSFFFLGLPAALGFRPPWSADWLVLPLIPFVLIAWVWMLWRDRNHPGRAGRVLLYAPLGLLLLVFVFTPFGVDPSGRYFLPFCILLPVLAGGVFIHLAGRKRNLFLAGMALILIFQAAGIFQAEKLSADGFTTQFAPHTGIDQARMGEVQQFLLAHGETRGYTTYWVSYPLAFLSDEALIFTPRLPYHQDFRYTSRDDRYQPYQRALADAETTALVTYQFPALDARIRELLRGKQITWQEESIADYRIFYDLSARIETEDLNFPVE